MDPEKYFNGKVVLITGASSGIGELAALQFARLNARVVLAARSCDKLKILESRIGAEGKQALAVQADVSSRADVNALVSAAIQYCGNIDILISNAGQYNQGNIIETDIETFRQSFEVNFFSHLNLVKAVLPFMLRQNSGHIVLMNTLDAKKCIVGDSPYVSAKAALDGLGDALRQELSDKSIRVTSVYPGRVNTPMLKNVKVPWISPKISPETVVRRMIAAIMTNKPIVIVPQVYYLLPALNNLAPRFMDWAYKFLHLHGEKEKI